MTTFALALREAALTEYRGPGVRLGFFGTGQRVHLYVGSPEQGWWCACGGVSHNVNHTHPDYDGAGPALAPKGATVDCWRCAQAVGLAQGSPKEQPRVLRARAHSLLRTAYDAALAFIEASPCDNDITVKQRLAWAAFVEARREMEGVGVFQ